jgi:hypothetical protein
VPTQAPRTDVEDGLASLPSEAESIEARVAPFRGLTLAEGLEAPAGLVRAVLAPAGDRRPLRDEDHDPSRPYRVDPALGARRR